MAHEVPAIGCVGMTNPALQHELLIAIESQDLLRVRQSIAAGSDVNLPTRSPDGDTPLIRAVVAGNLEILKALLELGADVNLRQKASRQWTPLMFAHDKPAVLRALLESGADVNARTPAEATNFLHSERAWRGGETALHLSAAANNAEAVKLLISVGAEIEARAENGCAPLDCALWRGNVTETAEALVEAGATLTPERLETMHSTAHRPDSDVFQFPFASKLNSAPADNQSKHPANKIEDLARRDPRMESAQAEPVRCPKCGALLYSRRPKLCGQCGALLSRELIVTDAEAEALAEQRQWARDLANKFETKGAFESRVTREATTGSASNADSLQNGSPEELIQRISCGEEFKRRPRPLFTLILIVKDYF